ncbi:hypothetical protein BV22DRAFT_937898 [Leucogyrophana mollusca]|uniref:Uncharacterized protein n=1 Tax=Leucogyrophana mollusca TaxID=85980 RepID=A0ACB8AVX9_9AGAM|nr:hypothetical protein BV22DRAFT_937898 [Leucogyrophana mollusca]
MATHQALLPVERVQFLLTSIEADGLVSASFPIWQVGCHVVIEAEGQRRQTANVTPSSHSNAEWDVIFPFTADRTALISICIYQSYAACIWRRERLIAKNVITVEELVRTCSGGGPTVFTIPTRGQKAACRSVTIALMVQHVVAIEKDTLGTPGSTDGRSNGGSSQLTLASVAIDGQLANDGVGPHDASGNIEVRIELLKV